VNTILLFDMHSLIFLFSRRIIPRPIPRGQMDSSTCNIIVSVSLGANVLSRFRTRITTTGSVTSV
jgi:hypothetical protein